VSAEAHPRHVRRLLPSDICVLETSEPAGLADDLVVEERASAGWPIGRRYEDLKAGRHLARRAVACLGVAPMPILRGSYGEPLWPEKVCGSITHTRDYCAVAVARRTLWSAVGIDVQDLRPVSDSVRARICGAQRTAWLALGAQGPLVAFSAKESVIKLWFQARRQALALDGLTVAPRQPGRFTALLTDAVTGRPVRLQGRYACSDRLVFSAIAIPYHAGVRLEAAAHVV